MLQQTNATTIDGRTTRRRPKRSSRRPRHGPLIAMATVAAAVSAPPRRTTAPRVRDDVDGQEHAAREDRAADEGAEDQRRPQRAAREGTPVGREGHGGHLVTLAAVHRSRHPAATTPSRRGEPPSASRSGKVARISAPPPGASSTRMTPPCASTRPRTRYRPKPGPVLAPPCQKRENTSSRCWGAIPSPVVADQEVDGRRRRGARGLRRQPHGAAPWLRAFSTRLSTICSSRSGSAQMAPRSSGTSTTNRPRPRRPRQLGAQPAP